MSTSNYSLERQSFLDVLRGFALFGILIVNIMAFSSAYYASGIASPLQNSLWEDAVTFSIATLFETKFYLLFSFLFGYSFSIQMISAEKKQKPFKVLFMRRLLGLFCIGLIHALLLYHGDILSTYALMGILLLALRHQTDRVLMGCAITLICLTTLLWLLLAWMTPPIPDPINLVLQIESVQHQYLMDWSTLIAQHWRGLQGVWVITLMMQAPIALAMFCLGFIAGRRQLFLNLEHYQLYFPRVLRLAGQVALPVGVFYGYASTFQPGSALEIFALALTILSAPLLSAGYAVCLLKLYQTKYLHKVFALLASAGRMALTNYILQSIICTYLFFGVGFGWMGQLTPSQTVAIAFSIFIFQCGLSHLWLRYFSYGPLEWGLRCFTYLKFFPWLRRK